MSATVHRPGETFAGYTQLVVDTCITCGIVFAVPEEMERQARKRGNFEIMIHCPNGHSQGYGNSPLDKARARADREADRAARLAAEREIRASERAQRAAATRARNEPSPRGERRVPVLQANVQAARPAHEGQAPGVR